MKFGNTQFTTPVTPVIDATPDYAQGEVIASAAMEINLSANGGGRGVVQTVVVTDKANQKPTMTLLFFKDAPSGTFTKNAAVAFNATDRSNFLGKIQVASTDWTTLGTDAVATAYGPLPVVGKGTVGTPGAGTSIVPSKFTVYVVAIADAAYNAGAADDLTFAFGLLCD